MNAMLKSTDRPISQTYRLALLDLDASSTGARTGGTRRRFHQAAQRAGMQVEYTTNNSSVSSASSPSSFEASALTSNRGRSSTSSVVAARMVARHVPAGARILVLGAEHLREEVAGQGLTW